MMECYIINVVRTTEHIDNVFQCKSVSLKSKSPKDLRLHAQ